jgi:hypothetical protein
VAEREALNTGLLKRIGDRVLVSIWSDKWISGIQSMTPLVQIDREELNKVSDLIDYENWMWKIELIRINFTAPRCYI